MIDAKLQATVCDVLEAIIRHDYGAAQIALDVLKGNTPAEEVPWGPIRPGSAGFPTNEPIPGEYVEQYPSDYRIPGPVSLTEASEEGSARLYRQETSDVLAKQQAHDQEVARAYRENHEEMMQELRNLRMEMHQRAVDNPNPNPSGEVHTMRDPGDSGGEGAKLIEQQQQQRQKTEQERKAREKEERERIAREKAQQTNKPQ
jgi:hypothetical protein